MKILILFCALSALFSSPAHAEPQLALYGGGFDFAQQDDDASLIGAEYRFDDFYHGLRPVAGAFVTSDSGVYGYGGLQWDIYFTDHFVVAPQLAAGAYSDGAGKDLHHWLQFRSQLELGYEFKDNTRLSLGIAHLSNASLGDDNPGTEMLTVSYSFPTEWF